MQAVDPLGPNAVPVEIRLPRYPLRKDRTRSALFIDYVPALRIVVRSFRKDQPLNKQPWVEPGHLRHQALYHLLRDGDEVQIVGGGGDPSCSRL